MWRKFWDLCERIPIGVINFLTIISFLIGIITPIIGAIKVKKLYSEGKGYWTLYCVTVVVLSILIILMFRYMIKYRKLFTGTKRVTTASFFCLSRNFRNSYFEIMSLKKQEKLTVELLTEKVEKFLQKSLDDLCKIYKEFTYQDVCACIKYIESIGSDDRESATIKTLVRSSNSDIRRCEKDNNDSSVIYVKDNTDFYSILSPNSSNKKSYFYQRNLIRYAKDAEKNGDSYNNSTKNWEKYYKATIVVPISIANRRVFFTEKSFCYNVIGFLCIDSLSTDAFLERDERYNVEVAQAYAAELYVSLNQYKHYMHKLTERVDSSNGR